MSSCVPRLINVRFVSPPPLPCPILSGRSWEVDFCFDALFVFLMIGLVLRLVMIRSRVFFCECISSLFLFPWVEKSSWGNVQRILCRYFFYCRADFTVKVVVYVDNSGDSFYVQSKLEIFS